MKKKIFALICLAGLLLPLAASANGGTVKLVNPIKCNSLLCVFIAAIRLFLGAVGVFALFVFMYGGFLMLTSGGNPETIKKSKDTLVWASLGILIILGSWVFISFLLESFAGVTGTSTTSPAEETTYLYNLTKHFFYAII